MRSKRFLILFFQQRHCMRRDAEALARKAEVLLGGRLDADAGHIDPHGIRQLFAHGRERDGKLWIM